VGADGLRILITNVTLASRTGSETFVRDLAVGLREAGDRPMVWSPILGPIADELRAAGVPVVGDLRSLPALPDIIHGHHNVTTLAAVLRFPTTPAVFVCHDRNSRFDAPPVFPSIRRWVAVDQNCRERLTQAGLPEDRIAVLYNWVDPERFAPRRTLPLEPRRALVFSNYTAPETVAVLETVCARRSISLDVVGTGAGNVTGEPERVLPEYDVVFAKGRSALEAMASGAAVVLFGPTGLGPLVTSRELDRLRPLNFGMRAITTPVTAENVDAELARYAADDATRVSAWIREHAAQGPAVKAWRNLYREIVAGAGSSAGSGDERIGLSEFLEGFGAYAWGLLEKTSVEQQGALRARVSRLEAERVHLEAQLTARLQVIERQGAELGRIPGLQAEHEHLRGQLAERLEVIEAQAAQLARLPGLEADAAHLADLRARSEVQLADVRARSEAQLAKSQQQLADLHARLAECEADRAARQVVVEEQGRRIAAAVAALAEAGLLTRLRVAWPAEVRRTRLLLAQARSVLESGRPAADGSSAPGR
jgi:hypothetical protein